VHIRAGIPRSTLLSLSPMEPLLEDLSHLYFLNQFWLSLFFIVPIILVARAVVAGTRYSPILIIVVFGLIMGYVISVTGVTGPGMPDFPMVSLLSRTTIVALAVTFFVGGQEMRKIFAKKSVEKDESVIYALDEVTLGTGRTHLVFVLRAFFLLLGMEGLVRLVVGFDPGDHLPRYYPMIAYMGLVVATVFVDNRAKITNRQRYLRKGVVEMVGLLLVLVVSYHISALIRPVIALPQIFFAMVLASGAGAMLYRWHHGPSIRCMLFAGIPIVLAANFLIGGSLIAQTFEISGIQRVLAYGFFGQVLWMFGGIALMMLVGGTANIRNLGPGMAGALSHTGLTGACTAGDFGPDAARRAPIMINVPFIVHVFVFSILAISMDRGELLLLPATGMVLGGVALTAFAYHRLRRADGKEDREVQALMLFSLGWQVTALFGGFFLLAMVGTSLPYAAMATTSALSHFGLFAAVQGGMFGPEVVALISFIFAMPFLVHPLVFFLFGRAMERGGEMPQKPVFVIASIGLLGVLYALLMA
jgi:hypothetical protein